MAAMAKVSLEQPKLRSTAGRVAGVLDARPYRVDVTSYA